MTRPNIRARCINRWTNGAIDGTNGFNFAHCKSSVTLPARRPECFVPTGVFLEECFFWSSTSDIVLSYCGHWQLIAGHLFAVACVKSAVCDDRMVPRFTFDRLEPAKFLKLFWIRGQQNCRPKTQLSICRSWFIADARRGRILWNSGCRCRCFRCLHDERPNFSSAGVIRVLRRGGLTYRR
jgi:hypothetical protein